jgi:hypothetical protein
MTDNNNWPGKPGVPLNPEVSGWHWFVRGDFYSLALWHRGHFTFQDTTAWPEEFSQLDMVYVGPCLTSAEVDARIAAAHKEWLAELNHDTDVLMENARDSAHEEAAQRLEELHKNHKYNPKTGEGSEHDTGYYRALAEGVAHIRALAKGEGNE